MELHTNQRNKLSTWCTNAAISTLVFFCSCSIPSIELLPRGAAELGYSTCVIDERPVAADIAPSRTGSYKWFSGQWYKPTPPTADHYATSDGGLVLSLGGDLVSAPQDFSPSLLPTLSGEKGFYVEFEVSLSSNDPDHFPAVWLMPIEHNGKKVDHYEGDPVEFERWMEFDVDEGGFSLGHSGAVHSWSGVYPHYERVSMKDLSAQPLDRTQQHRFGISFDPVLEQATWWIDDRRQKTVSLRGMCQTAKIQHFYIIIGAQNHGKARPYFMAVGRVRAFQSG